MKRVASKCAFASIISLAFAASMAFAKMPSLGHSSEKSATLDIVGNTQVPGGPTLQPGSYKVVVQGDSSAPQIGFYLKGKLVGQAAASLVDEAQKSTDTEAHLNNSSGTSVLTEIEVSGWTKKIEFGQPSGGTGSGQ